jgi:hypothetical protein
LVKNLINVLNKKDVSIFKAGILGADLDKATALRSI